MNIPKIDIHIHTAVHQYPEVVPMQYGVNLPLLTPEEVLAMDDKINVKKSVILPGVSSESIDTSVVSNEAVYGVIKKYPERFDWFCCIDPRAFFNNPQADLSFLLEHYKKLGAKGVGEITANLPIEDLRVQNLFAHCQKNAMPLLFHLSPTNGNNYGLYDKIGLPGLEASLKKYPDQIFIGHSQTFWAEISANLTEEERGGYPRGKVTEGTIARLLSRYPNLYCDMSAGSGRNAFMRDPDYTFEFIERFSDRLMFGTDICLTTQTFPYLFSEWLENAYTEGNISLTNYEKLCWRNASKLLNIKI